MVNSHKKCCDEFGKKISVTLQFMDRYWGSNKRGITDSWLGSVKCAEELQDMGLHSVISVKTNSNCKKKPRLDTVKWQDQ